jgi:hypothetical protein
MASTRIAALTGSPPNGGGSSEPGGRLEKRLYGRIACGEARGEPLAAALRNAQLALLHSTFAHPVKWAAFILID